MGENEQGGMLRNVVVLGLVSLISVIIIGGVVALAHTSTSATSNVIDGLNSSIVSNTNKTDYYSGPAIGDDGNAYNFNSDGTASLVVLQTKNVTGDTLLYKSSTMYKGVKYAVTRISNVDSDSSWERIEGYNYRSGDGKYTIETSELSSSVTKLAFQEGIQVIDRLPDRPDKLSSLVLPESLTTIKNWSFVDIQPVANTKYDIVIPKNVVTIDTYAFINNYAGDPMGKISFEAGSKIKDISDYAFTGMRPTEIELPDGLETIGDYAFSDHDANLVVKIPSSVKKIGDNAFNTYFENNTNKSKYIIENGGHPTIGENAFSWSPESYNRVYNQISPVYEGA